MKTILITLVTIFMISDASAQLKMNAAGDFGIGTDPQSSWKLKISGPVRLEGPSSSHYAVLDILTNSNSLFGLHVSGPATSSPYMIWSNGDNFATGGWDSPSDIRFKKNISSLDGNIMLAKLMRLEGKTYEYKSPEEIEGIYAEMTRDIQHKRPVPQFSAGLKYGLIAQELEAEFPELVKTDPLSNIKAVNYEGMIPILLEAVKTLHTDIETLKAEVSGKKSLKAGIAINENTIVNDESNVSNNARLEQNRPNPFSQRTAIRMVVPEEAASAEIKITNLQGVVLQQKAINERGNVNLVLEAPNLLPGIYVYALVVDGKEIDAKRMIINE